MADSDSGTEGVDETPEKSREELRREVDEKYDFENFGPEDMAEMSLEEWEVAFDPDSWITGTELLDRVEADLKHRIALREVFAVVERITRDGEPQLAAYSDEGYAIVYPDGSVEGRGTVLRDVKPTVALASMEEYEVPEPPEDDQLPQPDDVTEGSGELGNKLMQTIGVIHVLGGIGMSLAWLLIVLGILSVPESVRDGAPFWHSSAVPSSCSACSSFSSWRTPGFPTDSGPKSIETGCVRRASNRGPDPTFSRSTRTSRTTEHGRDGSKRPLVAIHRHRWV